MNPLRNNHASRTRTLASAIAVCVALLAGCASTDDATPTEQVDATPPSSAEEGDEEVGFSTEKALKKDYCCVAKKSNVVQWCLQYTNSLKASVSLNCGAAGADKVIRDGRCEQYASCQGKIPHL
ncbi:MAG: hypothetical protein ABW252_09620 [Polyangiales bacterium]